MVDTTILKSNYPAQYYGKISNNKSLSLPFYDVWSLQDSTGNSVNPIDIPPASELVALTATQVELLHTTPASGSFNIAINTANKTILHPDRYYCDSRTPACFYDAWGYSDISVIPDTEELHALTKTQWNARQDSVRTGLQDYFWDEVNDALVTYTAPPVIVPLTKQASSEMTGWISSQAAIATSMGETFTEDMKNYVKSVRAIAAGTDTTSTSLPTRPTDIMS